MSRLFRLFLVSLTVISVSHSEINEFQPQTTDKRYEINSALDLYSIDSENHVINKRQASTRSYADRPRSDQKSLSIVFDGTGSMSTDLAQLSSAAKEIINKFSSLKDNPIYNYVLVIFRDPDIETTLNTRNPNDLLQKLIAITVDGGGDCPEMALTGLRNTLTATLPNSFVFVFTDASAKDFNLYDDVVKLIQTKQVTVNFLTTGNCNGKDDPSFKVYHRLASASNGQVYDMKRGNVKDVLMAVTNTMSSDYTSLGSIDSESAGTSSIQVNVDNSVKDLSVSISGVNPSIKLKDPEKKVVAGNTTLSLENVLVVSVKDPKKGTWTAEATAQSPHTMRLGALTNLKFDFGFSLDRVEKKSATSFQPLVGHKNVLTIFITNSSQVDKMNDVTIIPSDGSSKFKIPLQKVNNDVYSTESFDLPRNMFKIQLDGVDVNGNAIKRLISTGLAATTGSAPEVEIEINQKDVYENQKLDIKCTVKSHTPVDITWNFKGKILKQLKSIQSNDLNLNIQKVQLSDAGVYKCNSVNSIGSKAEEISVKILKSPTVKITTDATEMLDGSSYSLRCNVEGTRGEKIEYSWVDNYGKVLEKDNPVITFTAEPSYHNRIIKCIAQIDEINVENSITLAIITKPKINQIVMYDNRKEVGDSVTALEGKRIALECIVDGTMATTHWTKDGVKFSDGQILELKAIAVDDAGKYECVTKNRVDSAKKSVNISVFYSPRSKPKTKRQFESEIGDVVTIKCDLDGNPKPDRFEWWKNSKQIFGVRDKYRFIGDSLMFLADHNDGGSYTCQGSNKYGRRYNDFTLNVLSFPKLLKPDDEEIALESGQSERISCEATGNPTPNVRFENKDGTVLSRRSTFEVDFDAFSDNAVIHCIAENSNGRASKKFKIAVTEPVQIISTFRPVVRIQMGKTYSVKCEAKGVPKPTIKWLDEDENVLSTENILVLNTNMKQGAIICTADNKLSSDEKSLTLKFIQMGGNRRRKVGRVG